MRGGSEQRADGELAARKLEHVELALASSAASTVDPGWDDVRLVPRALPELSLDDVDLGTPFLGHQLGAPVLLAPMTGGHPDLAPLNAALGEAAERFGLAVGVGSQRAALADPALADSYAAVRRHAPAAVVLANIGAGQLIEQEGTPPLSMDQITEAIDMVRADVLTVHLNVAQEAIQPEGDAVAGPVLPALSALVDRCPVPVVVKETGSGMTGADVRRLADVGVAAVDVGGSGGTSFVDIEGARASRAGDERGARLAATFRGWGVPTAAAVLEARGAGVPVIATGGVRTGLDVARALALGASLAGIGRVVMVTAQQGAEALAGMLELLLDELRLACLLSGARTPAELATTSPVLAGATLEWVRQRGLSGP